MRIALLGATGFVGSAILNEAVDRGHTVTAVVRHPEKLPKRDRLLAIAGDVYDVDQLTKTLHGHEAIISAFNPGWKNPNLYDDQVKGTESIIAAFGKAGIKRVLWVGGAGGLEVSPGVKVIDAPDFPDWVKPGSLAPSAQLEPGERTGTFRLGADQLPVDAKGQSKISVQDFAVAMINELENPQHVRQRFTAGY